MDGETGNEIEQSSEAESDESDGIDLSDWEESDEAGNDYADDSEAESDNEDIIEEVKDGISSSKGCGCAPKCVVASTPSSASESSENVGA